MTTTTGTSNWRDIDGWWDVFVDAHSLVHVSDSTVLLDDSWLSGEWDLLDPWWDVNVRSLRDSISELQTVFADAREAWTLSASSFDEDPLTTDWASNPLQSGPLQINQEENWSQWLAHTIRSGPAAFSKELFGGAFESRPSAVEREVHLMDPENKDRFADILVFYGERGISIEVKKGDTNYEKTIHTASLVESQINKRWDHFMLLPKNKMTALRRSFGGQLKEPANGPPSIQADESDTLHEDIKILHWEGVSAAIRTVLMTEPELSSHWESSAYLLCTLIEQKIARFVPEPIVDSVIEATDVIRTTSLMRLADTDLEEQIAYLRSTLQQTTHE